MYTSGYPTLAGCAAGGRTECARENSCEKESTNKGCLKVLCSY